jgi:hypothetical protein
MKALVRVFVVMGAIAGSVGLAGAGPVAAAASANDPLFMVADSVALGAAPAIHAAFPGRDVTILGHQGIFTSDAAELAWAHRGEIGATAIVGTGYNYPVWNPPLFDAWIDQMMTRLTAAGTQHVLWLTLREPPLGEHDIVSVWEQNHIADHYPAANDQLRAATARWPQLVLADWNAVARGGGLTWDGLHLTPAGQSAMADLLADEVGGLGRLAAGATLSVPVAAGTGAAALNVTVTWPRAAGFLTVWPCDQPRPVASNLNYVRHQTVANLTITRLAADGSACVYTSEDAHVVVDVEGTFGGTAGLETINPTRVLDTRAAGSAPPPAGSTVIVRPSVPTDARAVIATITATAAAAPGFVTAWPCDQPRPTASSLNYGTGGTVAGLAIVPKAADGSFCLFTLAPAHLLVDVAGWFSASAPLTPVTPARLADTRANAARLGAGGVLAVPAPAGAAAVAVTVTAADPDGAGYLTAYPCGGLPPVASTLNYLAGVPVANLALVGDGAGGQVCITSFAPSDVVVDLAASSPGGAGYAPAGPTRLADTRTRG